MPPRLIGSVLKRRQFAGEALQGNDIVARAAWHRLKPLRTGHGGLHCVTLPSGGKLNPRGEDVKETVIEISWSSRKLEKVCADDRQGSRHWGPDNWKILKRRLAALQAAPTLADMAGVPGNCHQLRADRAGEFAVNLWGAYRLVFEPAQYPVPVVEDGGIDQTLITRIEIKEVVDYHGK